MANFLGNIGAAFRGQQEYQTFLDQQAAAKIRLEADKEKLAEIKDLTSAAKKQRERQSDVDKGVLDFLSGPSSIPPPPTDAPQAPAPGQASVPMVQPPAQYGQKPLGPQMGMGPVGIQPPPQPMIRPQMPPQAQQMAPQGPQGGQGQQPGMPPAQPPVAPYRTVSGPNPQGQPGQQGIPPPPQQPMQQPQPNSMTLKDAAQFIKARGINDPATGMQILEKLSPYLTNEAKQEATMLKMQLAQQEKQAALQEKAREADQRSKDYNLSVDQRRDAAKESADIRRTLGLLTAGIAQQNANTKAKAEGGTGSTNADGSPAAGVEAAAWNYLLKGVNPPSRDKSFYKAAMGYVEQIAKDNKMSVQELTSASADVKSKLAAKKNFEVRAQNMERAENQILSEIPVMESAMKALDLSKIPAFQSGGIAALRAMGDPRVTTLDQAAETVFNEFQGIITGNPGTLNVSDVAQAKHNYENARTQQQMDAALAGMKRIMGNAKKALATTRKDIMEDINKSFGEKGGAKNASGPVQIKDAADYAKLPSGAEYITPDGQHKRKP